MKKALFLLLFGLAVFSCQIKKNTKELKTESYTIGNMKITEFINNQNGNIVEAIIADGKDTFIAKPIRPIGQRPNRPNAPDYYHCLEQCAIRLRICEKDCERVPNNQVYQCLERCSDQYSSCGRSCGFSLTRQ